MQNSVVIKKRNSQVINELDKAYTKVMQNIKSGKFVSLKSDTDIDKHIEKLKANYEQQNKN